MNADLKIERTLLGLLLAVLLGLIWLDVHSETAAQARAHKPWLAWLALRKPGAGISKPPALFLLMYSWDRRMLHLIQIPERASPRHSSAADQAPILNNMLEGAEESPLLVRWALNAENSESAPALKSWVLSRPGRLRFWLALPGVIRDMRRQGNREPTAYDVVLIAWEAFRLQPERVRTHLLPASKDLPAFFAKLESGTGREATSSPLRVAVLNASGERGVALQAAKVLRLRGLDVVDFGNAPAPSSVTHLIDYSSSNEEAGEVARILDCGDLETTDAMDSGRIERVTIVLGQDFKGCAFWDGSAKRP